MGKIAIGEEAATDTIAAALRRGEQTGFRIAVVGRTTAIMLVALLYLWSYHFPVNVGIAALTMLVALAGSSSLLAVGTPFEHRARFALFAFDASVITLLLTFVPLSSGDPIPQNLVFLTSWVQHYYLIIAAAVLTLSPALVVWTGLWAAGGLAFATTWIASRMPRVAGYEDLPVAPSRDVYFRTVLNPDFLAITSRIQEVCIILLVTAITAWAVYRARRVIVDHARSEARNRQVQDLFGRYVPTQVLRELLETGQLTPQVREATLLFVDIERFTTISEGMRPGDLVDMLNGFFTALAEVVERHGGVVVNHVGDAAIVSFNAPLPLPMHAAQAVRASDAILAMARERRFGGIALAIRIGVASGSISAGTVGGAGRQTYTVYGPPVNLAQRLEELNKTMGTRCLISRAAAEAARRGGFTALIGLGEVAIRGMSEPIEVFGLGDPNH